MEEDNPEHCKAEAPCEAVDGESEDDNDENGLEGDEESGVEDDEEDAGVIPHEVDAGDEVEGQESDIEGRVESVDCDHQHKAELGRNQFIENRESLKSEQEQGDLNKNLRWIRHRGAMSGIGLVWDGMGR